MKSKPVSDDLRRRVKAVSAEMIDIADSIPVSQWGFDAALLKSANEARKEAIGNSRQTPLQAKKSKPKSSNAALPLNKPSRVIEFAALTNRGSSSKPKPADPAPVKSVPKKSEKAVEKDEKQVQNEQKIAEIMKQKNVGKRPAALAGAQNGEAPVAKKAKLEAEKKSKKTAEKAKLEKEKQKAKLKEKKEQAKAVEKEQKSNGVNGTPKNKKETKKTVVTPEKTSKDVVAAKAEKSTPAKSKLPPAAVVEADSTDDESDDAEDDLELLSEEIDDELDTASETGEELDDSDLELDFEDGDFDEDGLFSDEEDEVDPADVDKVDTREVIVKGTPLIDRNQLRHTKNDESSDEEDEKDDSDSEAGVEVKSAKSASKKSNGVAVEQDDSSDDDDDEEEEGEEEEEDADEESEEESEEDDKKVIKTSKSASSKPTPEDLECDFDFARLVSKNNPNGKKKGPKSKSEKRDTFKGRDYKALLSKVQKRNERLQELNEKDPEKAKSMQQNIAWNKAMARVAGEKVKDNPAQLKKAAKLKEKRKARSVQKRQEREQQIEEKRAKKQHKRQTNIERRKDAKKKGVEKKLRKRGRIL